MEIVSVCVIPMVFSAVHLLMMVVVLINPASSSLLTYGVNECFERVSIGKRLNASDVSRSVTNTTLKQCDVECEREMCSAYAFGLGPRGNGTCELSIQLPKSPPNEDADYDLFVRLLQCRNMTMCFRRLVTGRRLIDRYIRRTFPSDSLARCQLACTIEREFICEGFNYRFGSSVEIGSSCQLTAMPGLNLDLTLDFSSDRDYDFYTRDRNAPVACGHLSYKTWNYGYTRKTKIGDDGLWHQPRDLWVPDEYYGVKIQPRIDYGDLYKPKWNSGYECFIRARTGFRLHRQAIVLTLNAPTLYDCEFVCSNEKKFMCNIISYRYSSIPSNDNCQLGEKTFRQLDFYFDLVPDRDYDVYVRNEFSRPNCQPSRTWDSDCFERIRSGLRLESSLVRFAVHTDTLVDCELICLHIRHFTCRAFSFRYSSTPQMGDYNCLLTDVPIPEMDPRRHFVEDSNCELYHRGSYGHGCELDHWPYNIHPVIPTGGNRKDWLPQVPLLPPVRPTVVTVTTTTSFTPYHRPTPSSPGPGTVPGHSIFTPTGKPYLPPDKPFRPPTYIPPKEPPRGTWNFGYDIHKKTDRICYIPYGSPARLSAQAVGNSVLVVNEQECKAECSKARDTTHFKCATISYWSGHCELSDIALRDLKPGHDFRQHDTYWLFSWDFTNPRCYAPAVIPPADGVWSSYTVSGRRCKWGSVCSHRADAGIWSCPVDDGDWDYCCRPDHHCGYSEGYNYPWCYVGSFSREQWRPCSDRYYPYQEHKRALHWPVSYVHKQGPPNGTTRYQPSLVDSFLESLQFDKDRLSNYNLTAAAANTPYPASVHPSGSNSSSANVLEFQIVDVTENPKSSANETSSKSWDWNESNKINNSTSANNRFGSIKRGHLQTTEQHSKAKKDVQKGSPSIT